MSNPVVLGENIRYKVRLVCSITHRCSCPLMTLLGAFGPLSSGRSWNASLGFSVSDRVSAAELHRGSTHVVLHNRHQYSKQIPVMGSEHTNIRNSEIPISRAFTTKLANPVRTRISQKLRNSSGRGTGIQASSRNVSVCGAGQRPHVRPLVVSGRYLWFRIQTWRRSCSFLVLIL